MPRAGEDRFYLAMHLETGSPNIAYLNTDESILGTYHVTLSNLLELFGSKLLSIIVENTSHGIRQCPQRAQCSSCSPITIQLILTMTEMQVRRTLSIQRQKRFLKT